MRSSAPKLIASYLSHGLNIGLVLALLTFGLATARLNGSMLPDSIAFSPDAVRADDGGLHHTWKGGVAKVTGQLEDHSLYALGLLELFKTTGDLRWFDWAVSLWDHIVAHYWEEDEAIFYSTSNRATPLVTRPRSDFDSAMPSDNGSAALLGIWLARHHIRPKAADKAHAVLRRCRSMMERGPTGFGSFWQTAEILLSAPSEIVIVGDAEERGAFERRVAARFLPSTVVMSSPGAGHHPLMEGRGDATALYLCQGGVCQNPIQDPADLDAQLPGLSAS